MTPAPAKTMESTTFEEIGRATLQIVHDLKNQLNGLKLYATFLRKRLDHDERAIEERETLAKLISGLDRAARDMTVLVKYAQPLEMRRQSHVNLGRIITEVAREADHVKGEASVACEIHDSVQGIFDPVALSEGLAAITENAAGVGSIKKAISIHLRKISSAEQEEALIEWQQTNASNVRPAQTSDGRLNLRKELATRIIKAHGGRLEFGANMIRAWLPLAETK
jgi:light-regulated signal transduction histidine kinase (bacteriophytochrome)